jgi:phospholipase/carboxylesterase
MIESKKQKIGELNTTIVRDTDKAPRAAIVLCHGFGAGGSDLVSIGKEIMQAKTEFADVVFLFPAAPLELDPNFDSRAWWMIDIEKIQMLQMTGKFRDMANESPERLPVCREMINEVIKFAHDTYDLPFKNIFIGGFSQGAMLTTDVALHHPEELGGLVIWSGALINQSVWTEKATRDPLTIFQSHGTVDPILPFAGAEMLHDMLKDKGHDVNFFGFAGQHEIPMPALIGLVELVERKS